ncbi:protein TASOR 2 isoform X16 [Manis pentadactyla]|uniref:protein TASOR 2 isoform X16 n=1 Tax=Manis pentadactyla TaxID=143292 RepID=UPI00255C3D32|nr:protein TASOR 2 isoform X16 [Manis pentadactyla]
MGKKLSNNRKVSGAAAAQRTAFMTLTENRTIVKNSGGILDENELRPPSQLHSFLEKTETGFISEKIFETVSLSSDSLFQRAVSILHTSYLDSASEHGFQYSQVTLVKNDIFLNEYKTFYQEKKTNNYTEEELKETYGFLLSETENQAKLVCQRGLRVGSSAVTTLGDPAKVFETVSLSSDSLFQRAVSILHTSYLDSASEHGFQYSQVTLVKNDIFLNEYKTFYQEKKTNNYTEEELKETYGFLLSETENQAKLVCQRGLRVGSSAVTTLGDPAKGVYISKYSDYLQARPWHPGKPGYVVIFNLITGKVKFVSENYTTNYTSPSPGYDCHVAANTNKVSHKTSHFRAFELSQYYLYELSGSTVTERPRQLCPYAIVAFQYREPKRMAVAAHKSIFELSENVLSPWKGKLIIQGCLLCDITLWSSYGSVVPAQLPYELDFKYIMKVSSLRKRLPEAAFRKQNYLEEKVCCQDLCFNMYEVELSNKQGDKIDKLTKYIQNKQLAIIKCLEDRGFFILLTSSALISETNFGDDQMGLHGLHLLHSSPSTAKGETASQLQSEISSDGQEDAISINTAQPESITVAHGDPPKNSLASCDSQALNMLADLALSASASPTPSSEPRKLPCPSGLPPSEVLPSEEHSSHGTSDHEYHRGAKSQKDGPLPKLSADKSNPPLDSTVDQEEGSLIPSTQAPVGTHLALPEETLKRPDASQSSFVAVEHSYALLLAKHSKKHLQQRVAGPAFAKNGTKGPEAGTPVGKVMPFRHQQNTSPLQKLSEDPLLQRKSRLLSSSPRDFYCSHTVFSCDGSFRVTFTCEAEYVFSLDSKYTNNPLEKAVVRALHGPWNTDLPDNVEEVKLILHMWMALFYSSQSKLIQSSRKVVEHSSPTKFVSINSTLDSLEVSELEEPPCAERCNPLLETDETPRGHTAEVSFPDTHSLLPFIKPPPARGLELWVHNELKEGFAGEGHSDTPESQNFINSCSNEVIGGKAKQESSDKLETLSLVPSDIGSTQTNEPSLPGEDTALEPLDSTRVTSYNDGVPQVTFTKSHDGISNQPAICQKSVYSTLESKVGVFQATMQTKPGASQGLIQHSSPINTESQPSLEGKDDTGYVMINLEPVTLTFEKNTYVPIPTERVNRASEPATFNIELMKQVAPSMSLRHPGSIFEKAQTLRDMPSVAMSGQKDPKCLCSSSVSRVAPAEELCSLQKETPDPGSSSSSGNSVVTEALSLGKSSNYSSPREEVKLSQEFSLQTQSLFSVSPEEVTEPSPIEEVGSSASASLEKNYALTRIPPLSATPHGASELKDEVGLSSEKRNFESCSSFSKQTSLSLNREEVSLELSEEDSDINLTLTISPPTSPREEMPAGEIEQHQEAPLSNLELQEMTEEIIESEEVTLRANREGNSTSYTSVHPTVSEKAVENERKSGNLQTVTLVLSKDTCCALQIAEEVNVTSHFPFGSLIEEVSPASSPNPQVPVEVPQVPSQAVSPCSLKLPDTQCENWDKFSQIEARDLAITEENNSFVGPPHPGGEGHLPWIQQMQLCAEMPLILNHHGREDRCSTLPSKVTEAIIPCECDEGFFPSDKAPYCDRELDQPALAANSTHEFRPSLEKWVTSGNPLQTVSVENRNLDLNHLVLETSEPPLSPRKIIENKSLADTFSSTTVPGGIENVSFEQETSPKSIKKSLLCSDLKTNEGGYTQAQSLSFDSVDGADVLQAHLCSETPRLDWSSGSTPLAHFTRPMNIELGFQTQEIPVGRVTSLLKNSETKAELHEKHGDLGGAGSQSNTASPKGEQETVLQDLSPCGTINLFNGGLFPMCVAADSYRHTAVTSDNTSMEPLAPFVPQPHSPLVYGISKEQIENKSTGERLRTKEDSEVLSGDMDVSVNPDIHNEPLSGDSDKDPCSDCRNPKVDEDDPCTSRCIHTKKKEDASEDVYDSFPSLTTSDNKDWGCSNQVPGLETSIPARNQSIGLKKEDKCVPCYIQIRDLHGIPRTYANFTVTKEFKDTTRTLHSSRRHSSFTAKCDLLSFWTNTCQVADNLTQSTLDLEYLRFAHKLKQMVKSGDSQHSDFSSNVFPEESPLQITAGAFPLTKPPETPVLHPASRSWSPLIVTVTHSDAGRQGQHMRDLTSSNLDSPSFWKERCDHSTQHLSNSERNQAVPLHLNKLKYNSPLKESQSDISLILSEYAELNKVVMNHSQVIFQDRESSVASGEATPQEMCSSLPRRPASYEDMITDLCTSLHAKLKSVVREACKRTFLFYLVETEDKSFFIRTKSILRKSGHAEIEPQHFCQAFHRKNETLIVIIRNEDISSHLHQIPSLLKLKHFPSVIFAGVDSPEDVLDCTYQELFQTGGFMVSDDKILETLTLVQLKEIVKILERLNGNGRWKWLLHYRENKKLKEDVRVDPIAHKKNLILKSYQSANIIELLHYHQCDSRSSTKAEHLKCLLTLQVQHIHARFAVFLTEKPTVSREVFENSGILITDVNNFIENIQKVAAPFRSSYW